MTTQEPTSADAGQSAADWWYGMIRKELMLKGEPEAAADVERMLRVTPKRDQEHHGLSNTEHPAAAGGTATGQDSDDSFTVASSLGDIIVRLNSATGETLSWIIERLSEDGDASAAPEELLALGTAIAKPPLDAERSQAGYEVVGNTTVFRIRWEHRHKGLLVEGDFLEVLINAKLGKVFAMTRLWRIPDPGGVATWR
ncbi:hypothetical protein JYT82_00640 [bacterium AH-315-K20]|nr:hypothetical protein [bacterium AH-315-K20]